jgi:hypothetical protein
MKTILVSLLALGISLLAGTAAATDVAHGQQLQQKNCMGCHDNNIYTRKERKITSLDGLHKQIHRCDQSLGLTWFDEDVDDVAAYLNQNFYHFK